MTENFIILFKINQLINSKKDLELITNFQIKRARNLFSGSFLIYDPKNILEKINLKNNKFVTKNSLYDWICSRNDNELLFLVNSSTTILDEELFKNLHNDFFYNPHPIIQVEGAIPGTYPASLTTVKFFKENFSQHISWFSKEVNFPKFYWNSQRICNNQFDLNRPIRVGIFLKLLKKIDSIEKLSFKEFLEIIDSRIISDFLIDYGIESLKAHKLERCPSCNSKNLKPLYFSTSQPAIGFLSPKHSPYFECLNCNLAFLRRECSMSDLHHFYDEYERPKINQEKAITSFLNGSASSHYREKLEELKILASLNLRDDASILDIGGGFGEFSCLVKQKHPSWNVTCIDFDCTHIEKILKFYNVESKNKNFLKDDIGHNYDVITLNHVIEHIPFTNLLPFLTKIKKSLNPDGYFLLSTPNFDSPLAIFFDYHLTFLPQHQTIFSENWLEQFMEKNNLFKKIKSESACVLLERYESWFSYYRDTSPLEQLQNTIKIFDSVFEDNLLFKNFLNRLNNKKQGSETIMLFQKI